jgi:hypothetical protein
MNKGTKALLVVLAVVVALAIGIGGFAAGFVTGGLNKASAFPGNEIVNNPLSSPHSFLSTPASSTLPATVLQVQQILENQALVPPTETSLTASTIDGMLKSLNDPYALYLNPSHFKAFNEMESGAFGGIGVTLGENKKGQAYVVKVLPETPAQ